MDEAVKKAYNTNPKIMKFNYVVNTADGAFFALAMGMVPLSTVLTYFISGFVSQKWLIGMLSCLNILLMYSPQILVSKKLESLRRYKPFLLASGFTLRLLWLLMGLNVILLAERSPVLFTVLFYVLYSLIGLFSAFTGITWLNFIVKLIPGRIRGRFFGVRSTIAGVFEAAGSIVMGAIVKAFPYPTNFGVLFLTVFGLTALSLSIVSLSHEPEEQKPQQPDDAGGYLSRMGSVLLHDRNFSAFLITVALMGGLGKMAFAFQVVFAKERLGIGIQDVSIATFIMLGCQTMGYLIWGIVGDRRGFKTTLELSAVLFLPAMLCTFMMTNLTVFYLSMGLFGLAQSARNINENNLAINLCKGREDQPLYIGLRNLLMGPFFAFYPVLAGIILDVLGNSTLFIVSGVFMVGGLYILRRYVKEYR